MRGPTSGKKGGAQENNMAVGVPSSWKTRAPVKLARRVEDNGQDKLTDLDAPGFRGAAKRTDGAISPGDRDEMALQGSGRAHSSHRGEPRPPEAAVYRNQRGVR